MMAAALTTLLGVITASTLYVTYASFRITRADERIWYLGSDLRRARTEILTALSDELTIRN